MKYRWIALLACSAVFTSGCGRKSGGASGPLKVAAAASLTEAFEEIAQAFEKKTGRAVLVSSGSSGKLAAQLAEGAPHDVFASASMKYVDEVISAGAAIADTKTTYAYGRVVVWTLEGVEPVEALEDLSAERFKKIALANPDHAPYGRAARQALQAGGIWASIESRVVYGTNVAQALQFADTGNADVALTALSLVISGGGARLLIDDELHKPLAQAAVVVKGTAKEAAARAFIEFLVSDEGHAILAKYGLLQKGQSVPAP